MIQLQIIYKQVNELKEYPINPRLHHKAKKRLKKIIQKYGFKVPILIKSDGEIIDGHLRVKIAKDLGLQEVPAIIIDDLSEEEIRALRIAINKIQELSAWDNEKLIAEIEELLNKGFKDENFGFTKVELDKILNPKFSYEYYTQKVCVPYYEPTGICPEIGDLYIADGLKEDLEAIENLKCSKELKHFLKLAAYRKVKFNYKNIAEFYCHQPPEVQRVMERLALVIIDLDDAIAYNYVELDRRINKLGELNLIA